MNYYEILEISRTASQDEVKSAYKKMAAVVHPDKGGSAMLFRLVQEAYEVLSDPVKRKQHDSDLAGPSSSSRQNNAQNSQQEQSHTYRSETNYIRVEDAYKRWKENRNRVAMPRSESYAAGGVRKMIRQSAIAFITSAINPKDFLNKKLNDLVLIHCGNCGFDAFQGKIKRINPLCVEDIFGDLGRIEEGQNVSKCGRCSTPAGVLRSIRAEVGKFMEEGIQIDKGDYIFFYNGKFIGYRAVFGEVIEGQARNEYGLKLLKVMDEFSGQVISPKNWANIYGHWKSNDLSKNRNGSLRNWKF